MATNKKVASTKTTAKPKQEKSNITPIVEPSIYEKAAERLAPKQNAVETPDGVINVRNRITFGEMTALVNSIVDMCTDDNTGEINWESFDYISKMAICVAYTGIGAPPDMEVGYSAVCGKDGLYETIKSHIDFEQRHSIIDSTIDKLRAREDLNNSTALSKLKELLDNVDGLMKMISEASDGYNPEEAMNALRQIGVFTGGAK